MKDRALHWSKHILLSCTALGLSLQAAAMPLSSATIPDPARVAQSVADRLVADTTFAFKPSLPRALDEGYSHIDFYDSLTASTDGIYFARAHVSVNNEQPVHVLPLDKLSTARFGISHSAGTVRVILDDRVIYQRTTETSHKPRGADYDRYAANHYVEVDLQPGSEHELIVKMAPAGDEARVWLGFFSASGASLGHRVSFSPPELELAPEYLHYLVAGPVDGERHDFTAQHPLEADSIDFTRTYPGLAGQELRWDLPRVHLHRKHSDKLEFADWRYFTGTILDSLYTVSDTFEQLDYSDYINRHMSFFLKNRDMIAGEREAHGLLHSPFGHYFRYALLDDTGVTSLPFAERYIRTYGAASGKGLDSADYRIAKRAAEHIMNDIPRLADGSIGRINPVPLTIWADDMFMGAGILMRMAKAEGNPAYESEAIKQILQIDRHLRDEESGVYWHGYFGHNKQHTSSKWGRANGWTIMAKTDALLALDERHPSYPAILDAYRKHAAGLLKLQSVEGRWHQVLDNPDTYLETSASSMFVRAFAEGIRNGWLERDQYLDATIKGWKAVTAQVDANGRVQGIVKGTPILFNDEQYDQQPKRLNDPRGLGAFLYMASSMEKLLETERSTAETVAAE
ncbi:glycoside hydrolase family 88/105 protein [Microbulbifer magnicolonia]|uniref:glycoside hydrolase family 88/105 protein n=1 Tax=Microbulbifer magnicolonia TaxID=3109744 RepID=UPI002B414895|nr:glycoside hydrolase family 88 protein [Microbulbifer sp. GG15]